MTETGEILTPVSNREEQKIRKENQKMIMGNDMIPKVFGSLPKSADTVLDKNENPTGTRPIITYRRKKMMDVKTYQRKKRKSSCKCENKGNDKETKGKLEPVREASNVFSQGNLEVSVTESKMEEIPNSSCDGNVIDDDVSVGSTDKETYVLEKLPCCSRRKLLILDLNGLLADIVLFPHTGYTPDKKVGSKSFFKRPFCDDFLKFCFDRFEVGVWSSRNKKNLDDAVDFLMGEMKQKLLFCWDQSHCTDTGQCTVENKKKPLVLKELKKLWDKHDPNLPWQKGDYNESNTLLVDDSPYKALCNPPHTAIFPYPFTYFDQKDNSLGPGGDLRVYLEGLATGGDIQKYVGEHPFGQSAITSKNPMWKYYLAAIGTRISYLQGSGRPSPPSLLPFYVNAAC